MWLAGDLNRFAGVTHSSSPQTGGSVRRTLMLSLRRHYTPDSRFSSSASCAADLAVRFARNIASGRPVDTDTRELKLAGYSDRKIAEIVESVATFI